MELYTGADEIQIQVRMRGIMHIDYTATVLYFQSFTDAGLKSLSLQPAEGENYDLTYLPALLTI